MMALLTQYPLVPLAYSIAILDYFQLRMLFCALAK